MLLLLISFLRDTLGLKVPTVFEYCSTRMVLAVITSLLVTIVFGKGFIKKLYEWKIGDRVRSEECPLLGELHRDKNDTPTMGGVLILFALLISLFLWMDLHSAFTLILLVTTATMGFLGGVDDYLKLRRQDTKGLSARKKLLIQAGISFLIALYLLWTPLSEALHFGQWFAPPVAKELTQEIPLREYAARLYVPFYKEPPPFVSDTPRPPSP